jgi:hypothetical protein
MPLTSAQEQYLKGLGIGKGAGRSGAISGAGKGAAIGTYIMPGIGTAVGGLIGGIGGWLKGRGASKKAQAEARAKLEQANAAFNKAEDTRLARVGAGQALLQGLQGRGFTNIDPETAAKLQTRRELDPAEAGLWNQFTGAGSQAGGELIDTAMDYASQYGINKADAGGAAPSGAGISAGQPIGGLNSALTLDDLYKLQGSGTRDFG